MAIPPEELKKRVRAARHYAGLSRDELAKRSGISKSTIQRLESDGVVKADRRSGRLGAIAQACGLQPAFFELDFSALDLFWLLQVAPDESVRDRVLHEIQETATADPASAEDLALAIGQQIGALQSRLITLKRSGAL